MRYASDETERPTEWLRHLAENRTLYRQLLEQTGSLAAAAYRLARARCRTQPMPALVPTATEVRVAADEISRYVGLRHRLGMRQLLDDCEHAGLTVIVPLSASAA